MEAGDPSPKEKRMKLTNEHMELVDKDAGGVIAVENNGEEDPEENTVGSEEILAEISRIHEQIQSFTKLVSELLDSGKSMLKALSDEFEERMFSIHKEQMQKWEEEIQAIRMVDASNVQESARLQNAKAMLQNVCGGL